MKNESNTSENVLCNIIYNNNNRIYNIQKRENGGKREVKRMWVCVYERLPQRQKAREMEFTTG